MPTIKLQWLVPLIRWWAKVCGRPYPEPPAYRGGSYADIETMGKLTDFMCTTTYRGDCRRCSLVLMGWNDGNDFVCSQHGVVERRLHCKDWVKKKRSVDQYQWEHRIGHCSTCRGAVILDNKKVVCKVLGVKQRRTDCHIWRERYEGGDDT